MSLPPWHSDDRDEQQAFLRWAVDALDEFDPHDLSEWMERANSDYNVRQVLEYGDRPLFERLRVDLPQLTWDAFSAARYGPKPNKPPQKRGVKPNAKVAAAKADNARLTQLFQRYYGETTRPGNPSRMAILNARHDLSAGEYTTVENYITKAR
jgi:hypothetical protein